MTHPAPEIRYIPADRLIVDQTVQRTYTDRRRVERIVAKYNPEALGVLMVSDRGDGTIHVMDGAHRLAATIAAGLEDAKLECKVHFGLLKAEEAAMFRVLNETRTVNALDKFRVRVVEQDPVAVGINEILTRHGWTLQQGTNVGNFNAVASLETIYLGGPKPSGPTANIGVVESLISVLTTAWGNNPDGVRREIISGVGYLLLRHGDRVDLPKLISELGAYSGGALALLGDARGLHKLRKGRVGDSLAEVVVNLLNKGKRSTNRLPDWRDD